MKIYLQPKVRRIGCSSIVYIVKDGSGYWLGVYSDRMEYRPTGYGREYGTCIRQRITKEAYEELNKVAKINKSKVPFFRHVSRDNRMHIPKNKSIAP